MEAPKTKLAAGAVRGDPLDPWARVLIRYVDDRGRVNYPKLAQNRADLDRFVAWIYQTGPNNQPQLFPSREHVIAYHINAFNALMLYTMLDGEVPEALSMVRRVQMLQVKQITVGGQQMSLKSYADEVIRRLGEPRIHFALNWMIRGAPKLARVPYRADTIDKTLELDAFTFLNEPRNVQIDHATRSVRLSEWLTDRADDFLITSPSVVSYVNQFRDVKIPESYTVRKIPLDYTVNWLTPPPKE